MVNVIVSCGSGLVTSALMEQGLIDIQEEYDLDIKITKIGMTSITSYLPDADILVTTGDYAGETGNVIKLTGTPILLGVGIEEFTEEFIRAIREVEARKK